MPSYHAICSNCEEEFHYTQSIKVKVKKRCPHCKKHTLEHLLYEPINVSVRNTNTVGQLAERNAKKFGKYGVEDKTIKGNSERQVDKYGRGEKLGYKYIQPEANLAKPDYSLLDLTPKQREKYIMTGKKPPAKKKQRKGK